MATKSKPQQTPKIHYESEAINRDVPIRAVISQYTGINADESAKQIHCPLPSHADKKPSAKIYGNVCHCFSCGGRITPITLAKECFPELNFPEICQKMIDDFGLDPYAYSNLAEIENIENSNKEHQFFDHFPVTETDLKFIGLNNPTGREEYTYGVKASFYYTELLGEIPPNAQVYDESGNELVIECSRREAVELGVIGLTAEEKESGKIDKHEFMKLPTLQDLWKNDKQGVEDIIVGKCFESIENINFRIDQMKTEITEYRSNHTTDQIKEAEKLRSGYEKAIYSGKFVRLNDVQKTKIDKLEEFEENKDLLRFFQNELIHVDTILGKVNDHMKAREAAAKQANKKSPWKSDR